MSQTINDFWEEFTEWLDDEIISHYPDIEFYEWSMFHFNHGGVEVTLLDNFGWDRFEEDISNILNDLDKKLPENIIFSHKIFDNTSDPDYKYCECDITFKMVVKDD